MIRRTAMILAGLVWAVSASAQECEIGCATAINTSVTVVTATDIRATTYELVRNGTVEVKSPLLTNGNAEFAYPTGFPAAGLQTFVIRMRGLNWTSETLSNTVQITDPSTARYLSDLPFIGTPVNGWGPIERDRSNGEQSAGDGAVLTVNGVTYTKGLGTHADSDLRVAVPAGAVRFESVIGIDDEVAARGQARFEVWVDGVVRYTSPDLTGTSASVPVSLALTNATELRLRTLSLGTPDSDHTDWADARFVLAATPPPPPPPPPPTSLGTVTMTRTVSCRMVITSPPPALPTSGWSVQFLRDGTNIGTVDSSSPFSRTVTVGPGTYVITARWTKAGVSTTYPVRTVTCAS